MPKAHAWLPYASVRLQGARGDVRVGAIASGAFRHSLKILHGLQLKEDHESAF